MPSPFDPGQVCVVLVATRNPLNIGAAARAMSNFGFLRLRVVNPFELAFREARSAVGASSVLINAEEYKSVAEAIADCSLVVGTTAAGRRELQHPMAALEEGVRLIRTQLGSGRLALLFGSEKRGLSNDDLSHCNFLMHIPTRDEHLSMNLGQAVAVCLYELSRQPGALEQVEAERARAGDVERIIATLLEALHASGYMKPQAGAVTEEKLRRMVRRFNLEARDAEVLLGMLRQIVWKLRSSENPDR